MNAGPSLDESENSDCLSAAVKSWNNVFLAKTTSTLFFFGERPNKPIV